MPIIGSADNWDADNRKSSVSLGPGAEYFNHNFVKVSSI